MCVHHVHSAAVPDLKQRLFCQDSQSTKTILNAYCSLTQTEDICHVYGELMILKAVTRYY